ncbi:TPA: DUF2591 family protein [Proteus mirabilis]
MNKYTELSDFEINRRVFVAAQIEHEDTNLYGNKVFYGDGANWIEFDPCNNPADAFPLIIDVKLSIHPDFYNNCKSWIVRTVHIPPVKDKSLTRAICIAYLMMKDAENED